MQWQLLQKGTIILLRFVRFNQFFFRRIKTSTMKWQLLQKGMNQKKNQNFIEGIQIAYITEKTPKTVVETRKKSEPNQEICECLKSEDSVKEMKTKRRRYFRMLQKRNQNNKKSNKRVQNEEFSNAFNVDTINTVEDISLNFEIGMYREKMNRKRMNGPKNDIRKISNKKK